MIYARVFGIPTPQARPRGRMQYKQRHQGNRPWVQVYNPQTKAMRHWHRAIAAAIKPWVPAEPLACALRVDLVFHMPVPRSQAGKRLSAEERRVLASMLHKARPDRDNLEKPVLDSLTRAGLWKDDGQVCCGEVTKRYAAGRVEPGCEIIVRRA